jgi:hypothetical protein
MITKQNKRHFLFQKEVIKDIVPVMLDNWKSTIFSSEDNFHDIFAELVEKSEPNEVIIPFVSIQIASILKWKKYEKIGNGLIFPTLYSMNDTRNSLYMNHWYSHIPKELLLNDYVYFTTVGDILSGHKIWPNDWERIFIRPVSPWKPFAGFDCNKQDLEFELNSRIYIENLLKSEIVTVARYKEIDKVEWRCYYIDEKFVTGVSYSWDTTIQLPTHVLEPIIQLTEKAGDYLLSIGSEWVIDIGSYQNEYKIIEVNAVSTSGWYKNLDTKPLLQSVDKLFVY